MKRTNYSICLIGILLLCLCLIFYDFSFQLKVDNQYVGKIYKLEEDVLVEIENVTLSVSGVQSKKLRSGLRLSGQLTVASESLEQTVFFTTPVSNIDKDLGWYRALLSSGPPVGGAIKIGEYVCNEIFFEKHILAFALPMENDMDTFLLVAVENEADIENARSVASKFWEQNSESSCCDASK